jgi:hypothetical protein
VPYFQGITGGTFRIYHNGSTKLATTATGIDVTGTVVADGLTVDGNVGIGTSSPNQTLEVAGSSAAIRVNDTALGTNVYGDILTESGALFTLRSRGGASTHGSIDFRTWNGTDDLSRMRIDSSGNVGIGTSSPDTIIHVMHSTSPTLTLERNSTSLADSNVIGRISMAHKDSNDAGVAVQIIGRAEGTAGAAGLAFNTGTPTSIAERVRIDSTGNVGIGTSSPAETLQIREDNAAGLGAVLSLANSNTSSLTGNSVGIGFSAYTVLAIDHASYRGATIVAETTGAGNAHALKFSTSTTSAAPTERVRIDSSGNVGIGTSSPTNPLTVIGSATIGTTTAAPITTELHVHKNAAGGDISFGDESTVVISTNATGAGGQGYIGSLWFGSQDISSVNQYGWKMAGMAGYMSGDTSATGGSADLLFYTANESQTGTERMRISSSGDLLVNTTDIDAGIGGTSVSGLAFSCRVSQGLRATTSATHYFNKTAAGNIFQFRAAGVNCGTIYVSGTTTAYTTSSDYRLKTDAQPMTGASARVQALKPVNFEWISSGERVDGFLAHEAQEVVPECVTGTKDAMRDEEYEVTAAVEATYDEDGNELTAAVEAVMGTRSVPDYAGH